MAEAVTAASLAEATPASVVEATPAVSVRTVSAGLTAAVSPALILQQATIAAFPCNPTVRVDRSCTMAFAEMDSTTSAHAGAEPAGLMGAGDGVIPGGDRRITIHGTGIGLPTIIRLIAITMKIWRPRMR